ncbi:MAG: creatininase [Betaproteobacteria bacterium]|jgi:creatinine amidohydrolase
MSTKEVLMNRMSWTDYRDRVQRDEPVVFLPCGATEQHGPHLPLGTDHLLATAVAQSVASAVSGIVAPPLAYGFKSQPKCGGGQHFCGTTSLDGATLVAQVRDTVREFARHGVKKLVLCNGHYENQWFLIEGIDLAMREFGATPPLSIMRMDYWDFFTAPTLSKIFPEGFPGYALEHAAVLETSMMLHYHPDLVRLDLIPDDGPANFPPYEMYPPQTELVPPSGVLSSARAASREKGDLMVDELTEQIAHAVRREFD